MLIYPDFSSVTASMISHQKKKDYTVPHVSRLLQPEQMQPGRLTFVGRQSLMRQTTLGLLKYKKGDVFLICTQDF